MKPIIELNESNFDREVLQSKQPVLVDFWAEWRGPCTMLGPALDEVAGEHQGRAIVAKVNVDDQPALAARLNIQSIPTLLYFSGGELGDQTVGVMSKRALVTKIESLQTKPADTQPA